MKRAIPFASGLLAAGCFLAARQFVFATLPVAGAIRLTETAWGGGGRLWVLLALAAGGALASLRWPRWALLLAALSLGFLADIDLAGWQWRAEKLAFLEEIGMAQLGKMIEWRVGAWCFGLAHIFNLALAIGIFYQRGAQRNPGPYLS